MVEFALALPVLLLLIFGLIEFGMLFSVYVGLTNSAREAARAGSIYQYQHPSNPNPDAPNTIQRTWTPSARRLWMRR